MAAFVTIGSTTVHAGSSASERGPQLSDDPAIERDANAFVAALKPRGPGRPLVAVLARNEGTETTDFLLTHAVLQRSGIADVVDDQTLCEIEQCFGAARRERVMMELEYAGPPRARLDRHGR